LILLAFAGKDQTDLVVHPVIEEYQLYAPTGWPCATQFWMIILSHWLVQNANLHVAMSNLRVKIFLVIGCHEFRAPPICSVPSIT
jgi:hypothetical protein